MFDVCILSIASPLYYALYKDGELYLSETIEGKTSDSLIQMYMRLKSNGYKIQAIYYASGPGNLSTLRLTHVFLHTLAIAEDIKLFATDGFSMIGDKPIFAFGNKYFIKKDDTIEFVALDNVKKSPFVFPLRLDKSIFTLECVPLYILPAV